MSVLLSTQCHKYNLLIRARSRSRSSELGARRKSFKLALGNSRPITGVTSNDSKASRVPLYLIGSRARPVNVIFSSFMGTTVGAVSVTADAMVRALDSSGYWMELLADVEVWKLRLGSPSYTSRGTRWCRLSARAICFVVPRPHCHNPADLERCCRTVRVKARLLCWWS